MNVLVDEIFLKKSVDPQNGKIDITKKQISEFKDTSSQGIPLD